MIICKSLDTSTREGGGNMNNYQEENCAPKSDNYLREMEQRMSERLQIVKQLRLLDSVTDTNHNIQLPTSRLN